MKKNLTELVMILDRSGSMGGLEGDTIGGYNSMLEKQQKEEGDAIISTILFDGVTEILHDRKDLSPNVCAVYTEEDYRCQGIAGKLLNLVVDDMKSKGITPLYLVTNHENFYERYGWEFYCMAQGDDEPDMTRLYIHR